MNALTQTEQAEEYINRFALRELVEEWLSRASVECPEDPYQYLIDEATDQRRSGGGIVTCDNKWCGATMPASRFAAHQETCNNAASWVRCVRCNTRVDASKMSQHRMFCKLERCTLCGEMVLPRMLPMCPYRKVAKAERDRQAAMHRKERRLERQALERGEAVPLLTDAAAPVSPQHASPTAAGAKEVNSPSSGRAIPQSQTPLSSPVSTTPAAAAAAQFPEAAAVQPIMVNSSSPSSVFAPAAVVVVESEGAGGATPRRNKAVAGSGTAAAGAEAAVPRPSFPAFTAADAELREKLESYPDQLLPPLTTIQIFWRRNMALHLFREQVFGAVWRHMDSAQEGAGGQSKEGAAIRLVERNLRSDRRISSVDENGVTTSAAAAAAATAAAKTAAEGDAGDPSLRDGEFCADEVPVASFQSDPVTVSESQLSHGGYMRVRDYEALTRHCQAREVLQFSVVLKIVRAATKLLRERPLVQHIAIPANSSLVVVGDLHGQMKDLEYILNYMGTPSPERSYLFNGDFIDRGPYGCEVLMVIYGLLCTYPDYVYVNRGNHENYSTNTEYGFMAELYAKYAGRASYLLDAMTDSYEVMSLMSIVDNRVAVVHGGVPRLECKLAEIEEIGHVRDIPVEQQSTRAEQLLAELLWNDPVEKFRSRQLGLNHQGEGWRSSSRGCGVEYLTSITEQFLKINDLKLVIRSHDVKTAGFELVHKNKSITVFSASNYGGVSGNRGAVAVLTPEAVQPVFHTWFLKEDYREHQQDNFFEGNMDVFFQDDRTRLRPGGGGATSPHKAESLQAAAAGEAPQLDSATGAMVVVGPDGHAVAAAAAGNALGGGMGGAVQQQQQQQPPKRVNAAMIAEAALMDGDEYICAYYLASGGVLDEEDLWSDTSSRSSAFSESEERANSDSPNASTDAPSAGASTSLSAASAAAARTTVGRSRASPPLGKPHNSNAAAAAASVAGGAGGSSAGQQRWPAGGATANSGSNARLSPGGQRGTRLSLTSHGSSAGAQGLSRAGCALAQDMSIVIQLQTLQQIRELIYFQRYALLVAFNQVDEMQTGTVYKAEWCVVMRDVLKLDIPWYYLCQFLVPRLVVDGVPSVEYMRFLRHFDVCFALDFRLSWQKSTIQRISGGLDLPDDIISAFCERPAVGGSGAGNRNAMDASVQLSPGEPPSAATLAERAGGELAVTSSLAMATTTALDSSAAAAAGQSPPTTITSLEASWDVPSIGANAGAAPQPAMINGYVDDDDDEDDDWWCDVQLDFKTFATKVRVLSPAAAAMEDNEIFALFCFFDVSLQGHVYVGDMVESITAVMDEEGSVDEAELLVSGEIDFSAVAGGGRGDNANHPRSPSSSSYSSSSSSSSSSDGASPRQQPASDAETRVDNNNGGGGRNLFASKMTMTGMKSRLMRPPTPSSEEEGGEDDDGEAARSSGSLTGNDRDRDASFAARAFSPTAPASRADAYPSPLNDPPLSSAPTAANFLATVDSTGVAAVGDAASTVMDSASCSGSRRTQPGETEGGAPPPLPHHQPCPLGRLSDASDAEGSVASTRPAASTRSSDGGSPGATTLPATARKSDPLSTEDERADSSDSGSSPRLSSKTSRVRSVDDSPAHGPAVGVLPLEYEEDESEPEEADATVLPASSSSHGEVELWASTTLAPTAVPPPPPPPPPQPQPVPSPPRASSMTPSLLSPTAADKLFFAKAGVAGGVEFINAVQRLDAEGAAERSARGDDSREDAEDDAVPASAALSAPAGSAMAAVSTNGGSGIQGSSAAAPRPLHRSHSFNEYATSVTSNGSTSAAGMAMSRPFDDYNTNLFNANADTPSSGTGAGGAGGVAGSVKGGASSSSNGGSKSARIEQRVTKRLAMPPWIYPTLLRVQEQLLGGYMRLRFLFQALNRSRTGHLTEAEFLPLMEFMNCLLEHPLSGEQAHLLFVCVHDSAIRYVQAMRTRRRQRAGSVYADTVDLTGLRRQTSGAGAEPASDSDSAGSYARHRALDEQMRGECYILLVEFLAFFCVKPVQYEDEVEALEELLYEAAGGHASTTAASSFKDAMRQRSTDGVEGPRSFIPTGWDAARDDSAGVSMSSVSVTLSGGVQPSLWKGGEAVAWGQPAPAPIRLQRSAVEVVAPLPADGAPAGDGAAAAAAVTLPPPPPPPLSMSGRPSDSPSTAGFSASRGRGSSWGTPDNMSAMVPATTVGGFLLASPSAGRLSPRQRLSSVTIQSGGELAGSGSARGSLTGANNSSSNSHSGHAEWLSAQRTGNGGAATALADSAAESDDAAALRGVVAVSVVPAAQTDLLSALAALGGAYGENITVKELMQRLAARHHRSSRAALPADPSLAGHPQPRSHTLPLVLGANSLMSFVSGSSDDSSHDVGDAAAGNDTSPSASSSSASSSRRRQSRHRHHKRHQVPPVASQPAPQPHEAGGRRDSPGATAPLRSPLSVPPTPTLPMTSGAGSTALLRTASGHTYTVLLQARSGNGPELEFSLSSVQPVVSSQQQYHPQQHRSNSRVLTTPSPPAAQAMPMPSAGRSINSNASHHQRTSSLLEGSVASVSHRPYMLNRVTEQRVTVLSANAFAAHYGGQTPQPPPLMLSPGTAASIPSSFNVANDSNASSTSSGLDLSGKRGVADAGRGQVMGVVGIGGSRLRQRLKSQRSTKQGAAVFVASPNLCPEGELTSLSLVPSLVLPPAPPTRQLRRPFANGSSANASVMAKSGNASTVESRVAAAAEEGGQGVGSSTGASQPPLLPSAQAAASLLSGGVVSSAEGGVLASSTRTTPSQGTSGPAAAAVVAVPPSPTRPAASRVASQRPAGANGSVSGGGQPGHEKERPASEAAGNSPAETAATAAGPVVSTVASATPSAAAAAVVPEPSRAKARLDSSIATAKALQSTSAASPPAAPPRREKRPSVPGAASASTPSPSKPGAATGALRSGNSSATAAASATQHASLLSPIKAADAQQEQVAPLMELSKHCPTFTPEMLEVMPMNGSMLTSGRHPSNGGDGATQSFTTGDCSVPYSGASTNIPASTFTASQVNRMGALASASGFSNSAVTSLYVSHDPAAPSLFASGTAASSGTTAVGASPEHGSNGSGSAATTNGVAPVSSHHLPASKALPANHHGAASTAKVANSARSSSSSSGTTATATTGKLPPLSSSSGSSSLSATPHINNAINDADGGGSGHPNTGNSSHSAASSAKTGTSAAGAATAAGVLVARHSSRNPSLNSSRSRSGDRTAGMVRLKPKKRGATPPPSASAALAAPSAQQHRPSTPTSELSQSSTGVRSAGRVGRPANKSNSARQAAAAQTTPDVVQLMYSKAGASGTASGRPRAGARGSGVQSTTATTKSRDASRKQGHTQSLQSRRGSLKSLSSILAGTARVAPMPPSTSPPSAQAIVSPHAATARQRRPSEKGDASPAATPSNASGTRGGRPPKSRPVEAGEAVQLADKVPTHGPTSSNNAAAAAAPDAPPRRLSTVDTLPSIEKIFASSATSGLSPHGGKGGKAAEQAKASSSSRHQPQQQRSSKLLTVPPCNDIGSNLKVVDDDIKMFSVSSPMVPSPVRRRGSVL